MLFKTSSFEIEDWGLISYQEAFDKQLELRQKRIAGEIKNKILLLEHPAVITSGRQNCDEDYYHDKSWYQEKGIELCEAKRGGRLTYHGPGQLVIYFIASLRELKVKVPDFVQAIEKFLIELLEDYGIQAKMKCGSPGLFVGEKKIASIGLSVDRGVTMHGASINVNNDLEAFSYFKACGEGDQPSSINQETKSDLSLKSFKKNLISKLSQ